MQFRQIFSSVGKWWNTCINKISRSVFSRFNKMRLRKVRSEVTNLRDEAMRQRSEFNKTLKRVCDVMLACGCGCIGDGGRARAIKKYFNGKGSRGQTAMTSAVTISVRGLLEDAHGKCSQDVKVHHSVITGEDIQEERNTEEEVKVIGKCAVCTRNSTMVDNLNVALLEINEVVRYLNQELDFINWLLVQKNGQ